VQTTFHELHEKRYGHQLDLPVEIVNVRLSLKGHAAKIILSELKKNNEPDRHQEIQFVTLHDIENDVPVYQRNKLYCGQKITGPALITETVSTTYIEPGWLCEVEKNSCLLLHRL
jgi:N-methylhydantoinase A